MDKTSKIYGQNVQEHGGYGQIVHSSEQAFLTPALDHHEEDRAANEGSELPLHVCDGCASFQGFPGHLKDFLRKLFTVRA